MSLLDEVRKLEGDVVARLKELEPLMREYEQLRALAERLGVEYSPESAAASERAQTSPATSRQRAAAKKGTATRAAGKRRAATKPRTAGAKRRTGDTGARRSPRTAPADAAAAAAAPGAAKATTRTRRAGARKRGATRPGQRIDDVLRVVTANPGISVRDVGVRLGVDATGLYRVANKLTEDGRVRKDGTRLYAVESGSAVPASQAADTGANDGVTDAAGSPDIGSATRA
jgi:hypothetical protein